MDNKEERRENAKKINLMPEGANDEDYKGFKFKLFRVVPENVAVIRKGWITGRITVKGSGLRFFPWFDTKLISVASKNIDFPPEEFKTKDGIMVKIDIAATIKVVDPYKFETKGLNPLQELAVVTKSVIRNFVESLDAKDLTKDINNLDNIYQDRRFIKFEQKYGVRITDIQFENIELPDSLKADYEKTLMQENENKRRIAEAEANKKIADLEAEKIKIKGAAEAQARAQLQNIPLEQLFSLLEKSGMTNEQINSFINGYIYANSPNGKVVNIVGNNTNNSSMSETIASVEAAQNSNNNNFVGRRKR